MNPKISIIVPIYKVETYLNKCVDSILAQTFSDFELILVNDGSPDRCGEICEEYSKIDKRVKVIHKKNGGLSSARNAGIYIAKGNYIGFVDSDDFIHEEMYETLYYYAEMYASDVVLCDFLKVTNEDVDNVMCPEQKKVINFNNIEALYELYNANDEIISNAGNSIKWIVAWNKLYKRELFQDHQYEEGRICEDEFIIHKILYNCRCVTYVPKILYYYNKRLNSIIVSPYTFNRVDKVYALDDRANFFKSIRQKQLHIKAIKSFMEVFFWNYSMIKSELNNVPGRELKLLKKTFNKNLPYMIKNPLIGWKQKVFIVLFAIIPYLYKGSISRK